MIKQSQMSPDVLIYIQSIKKFFTENVTAQKYFAIEGNEEKFYNNVSEISQKNYEENGDPELSVEQFEELRNLISTNPEEGTVVTRAAFINIGNLGYMSLN